MVPPVIAALAGVLGPYLNTEVWDGETPRYDSAGNPITPQSVLGNWPAIGVMMADGAVKRKPMFRGEYFDIANVTAEVWGTERDQEETMSKAVDALLRRASTWDQMTTKMKALDDRVIRVVHAKVDQGGSVQQKEIRLDQSQLLYKGEMTIEVKVHCVMPL